MLQIDSSYSLGGADVLQHDAVGRLPVRRRHRLRDNPVYAKRALVAG